MKFHPSTALLGAVLAFVPISASAFVTTFATWESLAYGTEIANYPGEGWTISDPSVDPPGSGYALSYSSAIWDYGASVLSIGAEVGGWQSGPVATPPTTVYLSHDAAGQLVNTSFSVNFEIRGNAGIYAGRERDGFGFALRDSGNGNLIQVLLNPEAGGIGDAYRVAYTIGAGPVINAVDQNNDPMFIHSLAEYSMTFGFVSGGADPTFSSSILALGTVQTARIFGGTATGLGSANVDRFGAEWNVVDGGSGNNGLIFDNLAVVPESSTALLAGLASLGLLRRRRSH